MIRNMLSIWWTSGFGGTGTSSRFSPASRWTISRLQTSAPLLSKSPATGLETTANLLRNSSRDITALSGQISASLKPTAQEYKSVTATISRELARLTLASDELRKHNSQLMAQERSNNWRLQGFMMLSILLVGIVAGISIEKRQTTDALSNLGTQVERIQTPAAVPATVPVVKKNRKQCSER
jgi:hypothetical protein